MPRAILLLIVFLVAAPLHAQMGPAAPQPGSVFGRLKDRVGTTIDFEPGTVVCALALPPESPPFCEIVSAAWQDAFNAVVAGRDPHSKFGGLQGGVLAREGYHVKAGPRGDYEIANLPLRKRLALAAKVQGLWRPFREEIWLTDDQPRVERDIPFYTLGADPRACRVAEHSLQLKSIIKDTLVYAVVEVTETIVIENLDPSRAALPAESAATGAPWFQLGLLTAPGMDPAFLAGMYGTELLFLQGTNASSPGPVPLDARAQRPWTFGGMDNMHGRPVEYGPGPQVSLDPWHPLNLDGALDFIGEGETFFKLDPDDSGGRKASLVFNRPVPPAVGGKPGRLVLKLMHRGGIPLAQPESSVRVMRSLPLALRDLRIATDPTLEVGGVRADGHAKLLEAPEQGADGLVRYRAAAGALDVVGAGDRYIIAIALSARAREVLADVARRIQPPSKTETPAPAATGINMQGVFIMLAVVFAVGFLVAMVISLRSSREMQRKRLNEVDASRDEIIAAMKQLEADYKARKLSATAYLDQRKRLMARALEISVKGERA
ncbi:MAG: hypothetical protein IT462_04275 [Planctomycetes bacterium]|nr:hypothetical protein [Planctomycetota bacterium]